MALELGECAPLVGIAGFGGDLAQQDVPDIGGNGRRVAIGAKPHGMAGEPFASLFRGNVRINAALITIINPERTLADHNVAGSVFPAI